jgi:adenosyl cobinamide kinase/adenosyl cobinamide phosphate guanylyltransferase
MKITLEFGNEEAREAMQAQRAGVYLCTLQDLDEEFRRRWKHGEKQETTWEEVRKVFFDALVERSVELLEE